MSVRRYLGNTWYSLPEAAGRLRLGESAAEALLCSTRLPLCWLHVNLRARRLGEARALYVEREALDGLVLRMDALDAAFVDWPGEGARRLIV